MSYRDRTIIEADRKVQETAAALRRAVRRSLPRKRDRDAAILAAATMPITDKQIAARAGRAG